MYYKMPKRKNSLNAIWEHFENFPANGEAMCKLCKIVMKNNRPFNLKSHLLKKHKLTIRKGDTQMKSSYSLNKQTIKKVESSNTYIPPLILRSKKQTINVKINKQTLFRSYIGLVKDDGLPFNILDSPNLKNIIDPISDGLGEKLGKHFTLDSTNCQKTFSEIANNVRINMKLEMKNRLLSLKIDGVPKLSQNIFGISAQFIKDDKILSLILGIVELDGIGASTSNKLSTEILKILQKYDIQLDQVISITCDSEANMITTTKTLSNSNMMDEDIKPTEEDLNHTYLSNINNLENPLNLYVENIEICRCASHIAQLCALDVTKNPEIKRFLLSCRNFTKFIRHDTNGLKDIFERRELEIPQLDCSTRFGSTYKMVQTLLAAIDDLIGVESIRNKTLDENFENSDSLWEFMESYCAIFAPLQETTIKFQAEQMHYGNFYAQWLKCKILTTKIVQNNANQDLMSRIGKKLLESIEKRTFKLLENESLNACLFLDPRFHHTLNVQKRNQAIVYLKHLWEKLKTFPTDEGHEPVEKASSFKTQNNFEGCDAEEMLNSFLIQLHQSPSGEIANMDVFSKIGNLHLPFMRSDTDVLLFWKERKHSEPELYALSNVCFGIPSTQISIEEEFSSLKLILADDCNRNHETLEDILLAKLNTDILNEAISNLPFFEDED